MDWYKAISVALVVGVIGPAFWLLVNVLETKLQSRGVWLAGVDVAAWSTWRRLGRFLTHRRQHRSRANR